MVLLIRCSTVSIPSAIFRADQTAGLANFKPGQSMSIRGVCTGKTGMINFYYAPAFNNGSKGFYKASPAIAFKDCKQVE